MARKAKVETAAEVPEVVATFCGARDKEGRLCGLDQIQSPGGITCDDGHGGAPSLTLEELKESLKGVAPEQAVKPKSTTAEELKKALDDATEKEIRENAQPPSSWSNPNRQSKVSSFDPGFQSVIETLWVQDIKATYDSLEEALRVGDQRTDYGSVMRHLDEAERNARIAHKLWISSKLEKRRWDLDNEVTFGAMRGEATASLQREKEKGLRAKQITDADVESRCATMFPDEYRSQEITRYKLHLLVDSMQNLSDLWQSRCKSLQVILSKQR